MGIKVKSPGFISSVIFLFYSAWWILLRLDKSPSFLTGNHFSDSYAVLALFGGLAGISAARKWGGFKSLIGKSIYFLCFGLLAQALGQIIYSVYFYVFKQDVPYPSLGDIAYFGSVIIYIYAAILFTDATGIKNTIRQNKYKLVAVLVPFVLLSASYWVFLYHHQYDWSHPLTAFLDFGYPMGQAIYISLAVIAYLLSRKTLGGLMRPAILLTIFALLVQYLADFSFLYRQSRGTWVAGGYSDYTYLVAYFLMTISLLKFKNIYHNIQSDVPQADQNVAQSNQTGGQ